jgi:hypothetical protein
MSTSTYISITNLYLFHHKYYSLHFSIDKFGAYIKMESERTLHLQMTLTTKRMNEIGRAFLSQTKDEKPIDVIAFMHELVSTDMVKQVVPTVLTRTAQGHDPVDVIFSALVTAVEYGIALGKATADCNSLESLMEKETN